MRPEQCTCSGRLYDRDSMAQPLRALSQTAFTVYISWLTRCRSISNAVSKPDRFERSMRARWRLVPRSRTLRSVINLFHDISRVGGHSSTMLEKRSTGRGKHAGCKAGGKNHGRSSSRASDLVTVSGATPTGYILTSPQSVRIRPALARKIFSEALTMQRAIGTLQPTQALEAGH